MKLRGVKLEDGHPYCVRVEDLRGKQEQETEFCFAQTVRRMDEYRPLLVNRKEHEGNMALRIR